MPNSAALSDMIRLPGKCIIGSTVFYPEEAPVRVVDVTPFLIDRTPVTNAQFAAFVAATSYVTLAETAPDPAAYPGILPEMMVAGSIVFVAPQPGQPVVPESWWHYMPGASWRQPYGPDHGAIAPADHPVVQIAYGDALAYATWAGNRLPTETEAEFAARGGLGEDVSTLGEMTCFQPQRRAPISGSPVSLPPSRPQRPALYHPGHTLSGQSLRSVRSDRQCLGVDLQRCAWAVGQQ